MHITFADAVIIVAATCTGDKYGMFPENFVSLASKAQIAQMKQSKKASVESAPSHEDGGDRDDTTRSQPEGNSDDQVCSDERVIRPS